MQYQIVVAQSVAFKAVIEADDKLQNMIRHMPEWWD